MTDEMTIDWEYEANDTDDLRPQCGPFGAGAGDVVDGDVPPAEVITE